MPYVQLGDVHAYYEEDGDGDPLVLVHPGLADSRAFEEYLPALAERFRVYRPDRRGHGRTADVEGPITYDLMADETIAFLQQVVGGPAHVLGHSDGAPVALLAALKRPDLVRRLVFSAGVYHHDGWTPGSIELDEETTEFFLGYWGAVAPQGPATSPSSRPSSTACTARSRRSLRGRPRRLPRAGARDGRRPRPRDPPRAHARAVQGAARRPARGPARDRPRRASTPASSWTSSPDSGGERVGEAGRRPSRPPRRAAG